MKLLNLLLHSIGLNPLLDYLDDKIRVKVTRSCLKQDKVTYTHRTIVNIYIVYEITGYNDLSSFPTLENCLFGAVKLTKHPDIDKYKNSGYGTKFDRKGRFSFGNGFGHNALIFGVDMSSSVHVNSKTKIF